MPVPSQSLPEMNAVQEGAAGGAGADSQSPLILLPIICITASVVMIYDQDPSNNWTGTGLLLFSSASLGFFNIYVLDMILDGIEGAVN